LLVATNAALTVVMWPIPSSPRRGHAALVAGGCCSFYRVGRQLHASIAEAAMLRAVSFLLGFGLIGLWAAALATDHRTVWLMWMNFAGAVLAFGVGTIGGRRPALATGATDLLLAAGLLVLWAVGVTGRATAWQSWWTFAFGCAYLLLGLVGIVIGESRRASFQRMA